MMQQLFEQVERLQILNLLELYDVRIVCIYCLLAYIVHNYSNIEYVLELLFPNDMNVCGKQYLHTKMILFVPIATEI
jgi:hypothetical protein